MSMKSLFKRRSPWPRATKACLRLESRPLGAGSGLEDEEEQCEGARRACS
jgi:hypothetical protein